MSIMTGSVAACALALPGTAAATVLFNQNFEGVTLNNNVGNLPNTGVASGTTMSGWDGPTANGYGHASVVGSTLSGQPGKVVRITDNDPVAQHAANMYVTWQTLPANAYLIASLKYMVAAPSVASQVNIGNWNQGAVLSVANGNYTFYVGSNAYNVGTYQVGVWSELKFVINTSGLVYDFYLDGELKRTNITAGTINTNPVKKLEVWGDVGTVNGSNTPVVYMDDLYIEYITPDAPQGMLASLAPSGELVMNVAPIPEPVTLSVLGIGAVMMLMRRQRV